MKSQKLFLYKKQIILLITLVVINSLLSACGSTQPKTYTIGIINYAPVVNEIVDGFKTGMTEFGYIEGENITYIYYGAINDQEKLKEIAKEFVESDVDLILSMTTPATLIAKEATEGTDIPVLFAPTSDPVGTGIIQSLIKPGGHVTGVTFGVQEARRLEWLLKIAPDIKRMYVPYNPNDRSPVAALEKLKEAATELNIELVLHEIHGPDEIAETVASIPDDIDAIWGPPDALISSHIDQFVKVTFERNLPLSVPQHSSVEDGALISYGFNVFDVGKQASHLADQILKGAKPADLPVETSEFYLTLNLKTAKAIGIEIPEDVLKQAKTIVR